MDGWRYTNPGPWQQARVGAEGGRILRYGGSGITLGKYFDSETSACAFLTLTKVEKLTSWKLDKTVILNNKFKVGLLFDVWNLGGSELPRTLLVMGLLLCVIWRAAECTYSLASCCDVDDYAE